MISLAAISFIGFSINMASMIIPDFIVNSIISSYITCSFPSSEKIIKNQLEFYNIVVGKKLKLDEIMKIGERITNLRRAFNIKFGLTPKEDTLPKRITSE
jgi:aldehyde:ferredoxin oxidoreductase